MFCKECGTENLDTDIKCKNCNLLINDNLPLDGVERVKVVIVFLLLLTPPLWIIGIIVIASLYIMKKDKNFNSVINAQKYINICLYLCMGANIIFFITVIEILSFTLDNYYSYEVIFFFILWSLGFIISMWILNNFFFKILFNHQKWILDNNLFGDSPNDKSIVEIATEKIQMIPKEVVKEEITNKESINSIDELLKWAELKEKGLITEEEFKKVKEKIL